MKKPSHRFSSENSGFIVCFPPFLFTVPGFDCQGLFKQVPAILSKGHHQYPASLCCTAFSGPINTGLYSEAGARVTEGCMSDTLCPSSPRRSPAASKGPFGVDASSTLIHHPNTCLPSCHLIQETVNAIHPQWKTVVSYIAEKSDDRLVCRSPRQV